MRVPILLASLTVSLATVQAQVAPREAIVSVIANVAPSEGLWLADRAGNCTAITGLTAAGSAGFGVNAVQLDPVDDRIWLGGINSNGNTAGQVNFALLSGTTVSTFVQHGTTGLTGSIAAITFDDNGNPMVATSTASAGGGVFRIDRNTGGLGTLVTAIGTTQTHNAICRDPGGNLYVGMFSDGTIWKLPKNPDCTYSAAILLGTTPVTSVSGVEWCPGTPGQVFITTFGTAGNALFKVDDVGGPVTVASASIGSLNAIEYDRANDDFWLVTAGTNPDNVSTATRAGVETILCGLQGGNVGTPSGIDTCDCRDAETNVLPQCVSPNGGPIVLEFGTCCPPGSSAGIFIISPAVVPLLTGAVGGNGRLSGRVRVIMPPNTPRGAITFISACVDAAGRLTIGPPTRWPQ